VTLRAVYGLEDLRRRLADSASARRLPQSILLTGPSGSGKQRLGQWIGALLLCEAADRDRPCGSCRSCRLAAELQHPDIHCFFPLPAPKRASGPEKRRELLEEARASALAARRENPLLGPEESGSAAIYLQIVDEIRERASRRPAMSRGAVFIVGDADRMVPQASSPEAANAFLKLLEEPPNDTVFVLTSSRPGLLLPTIRSRVLAVRVPPVEAESVSRFLEREAGIEPSRAIELARRAEGRIGRALRLAEADEELRAPALRMVRSALSPDRSDRWAVAAALAPSGGRGPFAELLDALESVLRDCITLATDAPDFAADVGLASEISEAARISPERWISAASHVDTARDAALGNGNPQAIAAVLLSGLAQELRPTGTADRNGSPGRG
jgi:DNA polymerase-3 subunit delta'